MRRCMMVLLLAMVAGTARAGVIYTPTTGPGCRDYSKPQFGHWVCAGPGGYVAGFSDEGNIAAVAIGPRALAPHKLKAVSQFRGAKRVFGEKLEWHVTDGKVQSAVLRVWKTGEQEQELQQLEVYAVGTGKTCLIATVDAAQPDANAKAAAFAEEAARSPCVSP